MCTSQQKVSDPTVPREPGPHPLQANCTSPGETESIKVYPSEALRNWRACIPSICPGVKGYRPPFVSQSSAVLVTSVFFLWQFRHILRKYLFLWWSDQAAGCTPTFNYQILVGRCDISNTHISHTSPK